MKHLNLYRLLTTYRCIKARIGYYNVTYTDTDDHSILSIQTKAIGEKYIKKIKNPLKDKSKTNYIKQC